LISLDRGRNVRTPEHYLTLASICFEKVHSHVCDLHPWLPYTQFVMECLVQGPALAPRRTTIRNRDPAML
jgi:hypothetical protein